VKKWALVLLCSLVVTAQPPPLQELSQSLAQARHQAAGVNPEQMLLLSRFELLQVQSEQLQRGTGDWETFFRFYQVTQQQASRLAPLPSPLQQNWERIQTLMSQVGQSRGRALAPVGAVRGGLSPDPIQALQRVRQLESSLGAMPEGAEKGRYQEARAHLTGLRRSLESAARTPTPQILKEIVRYRRLLQVSRSSLQLNPERFWDLDQALDGFEP